MIQSSLPRHDVVLLGIGHTNAHMLRMWRMESIRAARLTCVSNLPVVTYSGMLPGTLAGQYPAERMEIDLVRLCAAAGARLILGEVVGLDTEKRELHFAERPPLPFDLLSIGIGSVPNRGGVEADETLLPIKPMQTFLARLDGRLNAAAEMLDGRPLRAVVVGGGAGGVEIALCLPERVKRVLPGVPLEISLIDAGVRLISGMTDRSEAALRREFSDRGVKLQLGSRVNALGEGDVRLASGEVLPADVVLWATNAAAPPLLDKLDLPKDAAGFLLTRPTLQTTGHDAVFAVGDTGTLEDSPTPKAGVYAVRQGPVLWENIKRSLAGEPLLPFRPQRGFLKLLNLGDGRSLAEYKGFTFRGRWCWKLKDFIDRRFMDKYQDYEPMEMADDQQTPLPMRCAGCGGKVGGSVLSAALARLEIPSRDDVLIGLDAADDAAVLKASPHASVLTVDFFSAPFDDPFLVGRIAALNAASDAFAMGAAPRAALAMATIPLGRPRQQEQLLFELLAGSQQEFRQMDVALVGGHTIEGPQLTVGFTIVADQAGGKPRAKGDLRVGDRLILTKPLGTGVLLAAHMAARCRAAWWPTLLESMLASNAPAARLLDQFEISGVTDVTGFGLAGHLLEMLRAADTACELDLARVPLLPGAEKLLEEGLESTLAPANRAAEQEIKVAESLRRTPAYAALFDPQTSGGLILAVRPEQLDELVAALQRQGVTAAVIGTVNPFDDGSRLCID